MKIQDNRSKAEVKDTFTMKVEKRMHPVLKKWKENISKLRMCTFGCDGVTGIRFRFTLLPSKKTTKKKNMIFRYWTIGSMSQ